MLLSGGSQPGKITKFLFELLPDLLPYDHLSETEIVLWAKHYSGMKERNG